MIFEAANADITPVDVGCDPQRGKRGAGGRLRGLRRSIALPVPNA
jgi:hypothetical protein